ncbi:hypothetical protein ABFX02_13G185400 [Erythranthe guttata]
MAYYLHRIIFVALVVAIAVPSSLGRRERSDLENDLRDLCSQTNKTKKCWNIIKSEFSRFSDADGNKGVAGVVIDLAIAKSDEIHDKLNQLYDDSKNDELKEKYLSCSKNYNDASRNLDLARRNLDSDDYRNISVQIDDTSDELKSCRHEFKKDSFDPAHIRNRNKEFKIYVEIVKVATDRLLQENDPQPEGNIN